MSLWLFLQTEVGAVTLFLDFDDGTNYTVQGFTFVDDTTDSAITTLSTNIASVQGQQTTQGQALCVFLVGRVLEREPVTL